MTIRIDLLRCAIAASLTVVIVFADTVSSAAHIYVDAEPREFESVPFTCTASPFKVIQQRIDNVLLD